MCLLTVAGEAHGNNHESEKGEFKISWKWGKNCCPTTGVGSASPTPAVIHHHPVTNPHHFCLLHRLLYLLFLLISGYPDQQGDSFTEWRHPHCIWDQTRNCCLLSVGVLSNHRLFYILLWILIMLIDCYL